MLFLESLALGGLVGLALTPRRPHRSFEDDTPVAPIRHAEGSGLWGAVFCCEIALATHYAKLTDEERANELASAKSEKERAQLLRLFPRPLVQVGPLDI